MADTRNKRKFDDSGPNISYNRVPPPPSDFEKARQKALQIAARINAEAPDLERDDGNRQDGKTSSQSSMPEARSRHKFDDAGPNTLDVELAKQRAQQILARFAVQDTKRTHMEEEPQQEDKPSQMQNSGQLFQSKRPEFSTGSFYGGHGPPEFRKVEIPNAKVGLVIGKGGDTIKQIQLQSGARVQITKDMDHNPNVPFRTVELMGTPEQIERAEQAIHDVIAEADAAAAAAAANSSHSTYVPVGEQIQLTVPTNKVGLIIGRGGETIKGLQSKTGARIQLVPLMGPPEHQSGVAERVLTLMGSKEQVDAASELIKELISENRVRPPLVQAGYQGYPPPPGPPQWGPPMQQGYGYQQGPYYPGPPQPYGSYPPPPPAAWSQTPPAPPQQYPPPGSYGYYNSQGQVEYPPAAGYEQQGPYAEHPPGALQDVYGQQIPGQPESYGQMGAYATYGSTDSSSFGPPGVTTTTNSQGGSQEGFGPPGVAESTYGKHISEQGPPGLGQEGGEVQHTSHQSYGTNEKQSSAYSYDDATATSYGQHDPLGSHYGPPGSTHPDGQQVGQSETGYWSNHYGYSGYETYQSTYGQQLPGYGQPPYEQQQEKQSQVPYEEMPTSVPTYGAGVHDSSYQQESAPVHLGEEQGATHEDSKKQGSRHENGYTFDMHHGSDKKDGTGESHSRDVAGGDQEPQS